MPGVSVVFGRSLQTDKWVHHDPLTTARAVYAVRIRVGLGR